MTNRISATLAVVVLLFALFLPGCGDDDDSDSGGGSGGDDTVVADDTIDDDVADDSDDTIADDTVGDDTSDDTSDDDASDDTTDDTADDTDDTSDDTSDDDTGGPITLDLVEGCNPFMTSTECLLPYPSAFFQADDQESPTGVRVQYPEGVLEFPAGVTPLDLTLTNTADGVSPGGPILVHFAKDIHENFLTKQRESDESLVFGSPMALFDYDSGERVRFMSEMDMNRRLLFPNRYALIVRPLTPMEMGQRHIMVLTNDL